MEIAMLAVGITLLGTWAFCVAIGVLMDYTFEKKANLEENMAIATVATVLTAVIIVIQSLYF